MRLSLSDLVFYKWAEVVARSSLCSRPHGAVIVRNGKQIVSTCNRRVTHPVSARMRGFDHAGVHAEQRALILARTDVRGCTMYSARASGRISTPCPMCYELMLDAGIGKVVYYDGEQMVKERL